MGRLKTIILNICSDLNITEDEFYSIPHGVQDKIIAYWVEPFTTGELAAIATNPLNDVDMNFIQSLRAFDDGVIYERDTGKSDENDSSNGNS